MKTFSSITYALIIAFFFSSCHSSTNNHTSFPTTTTPANSTEGNTGRNGKLYLLSGIVGGLNLSWLYLGDNGELVMNPLHGVDPLNYEAEKQDNSNVGTYQINGNQLNITWLSGKTESWPLETKDGDYSSINGLMAGRQDGLPEGYTINGTYGCTLSTANVAASRTFAFSNDGTFQLQGNGYINSNDHETEGAQSDGATSQAQSNTAGTYGIRGNTLFLNFNNGEKQAAVITVFDAGNSQQLVINENYFPLHK